MNTKVVTSTQLTAQKRDEIEKVQKKKILSSVSLCVNEITALFFGSSCEFYIALTMKVYFYNKKKCFIKEFYKRLKGKVSANYSEKPVSVERERVFEGKTRLPEH